jgi:YD repeat-containing protein
MKRSVFLVSVVILIGMGISAQKRSVNLPDASNHDQFTSFNENVNASSLKRPVLLSRVRAAKQEVAARQQLDSTVLVAADGIPLSKNVYTYDEWGNLSVTEGFSWVVETATWRPTSKKVDLVNKDGNLFLSEVYSLLNQSSELTCTSRMYSVWSEDSEGNRTENSTNYVYNYNTNQLEYSYKHEIVYMGHTTTYKELVYSRWLADVQQWKVLQRYYYSTSEPGYDDVVTDFTWNDETGSFVVTKTAYNYDSQGRLTEKTEFHDYDESTQQWKRAMAETVSVCSESYTTELEFKNNAWVPVFKYEKDGEYLITYTYMNGAFVPSTLKLEELDNFGNQIRYFLYNWNADKSTWIRKVTTNREFDTENNLLYEQIYNYSDSGKEVKFHQMYRESFTEPWIKNYTWQRFTFYDSNDRVDYYYTTTYLVNSNEFVNSNKRNYVYNDAGNIKQYLSSSWNGSDWTLSGTTTYYYSTLSDLVAREVKPIGADGTGVLLLQFNIATNLPFGNAAFAVLLPQGITLLPGSTVLSNELAGSHQLTITYAEDGTPQFTINAKENPVAEPAKPYQHIMLVSYKASPGVAIGRYNATIHNSYFNMINHTPVSNPSLQFTINVTETISGTATNVIPLFSIAPNPADELVLVIGAANKFLQVINLEGRKVLEKMVDSDEEKISLQGFARGMYMINIVEQGRVVGTEKLIIQ